MWYVCVGVCVCVCVCVGGVCGCVCGYKVEFCSTYRRLLSSYY